MSASPQPEDAKRNVPVSSRRAKRELPNWLSFFRLLSSPALAVLLLIDAEGLRFVTATIFALAAITDYLDGYLARRWQVVSTIGVFIDLAADKILVSTVLIVLVGTGAVPSWMAAVIVAREFLIAGLRSQAAASGVVISASQLGKWKTAITLVALLAALLYPMHSPPIWVQIGLWLATIITVVSAVDYIVRFWQTGVKT
jgi:CDP-diacylglycerol--glycerol-3-phosphate 3-phosphatidyltransferase